MFVFGTQYLRGETPERDQWMRDLENIRKNGFNTIRAWLNWNSLEKREGCIDEEYLYTFLDCVKQNDLQTGLLFHLHAAPEWANRKYKEFWYVNEEGIPFEPAPRANTPNGGWPGLCFDHDEVREIEKSFIERIVTITKGHDEVAFYEPMNEPHQWDDYQKKPTGMFCYCDASRKKFMHWLEKKYQTVERFNDAWGRHHNDFSEIALPHWVALGNDYVDYRLFTMDNIVEEITFRKQVIDSVDGEKPVIAHCWGSGSVGCMNLGGMAFDDWKNASVFPMWGLSAFPQSIDSSVVLGMACTATRNAAQGKPFWQSELSAGINGCGLWLHGKVDVNTFDNWNFESLRSGAKGLLYWQYRMERYGREIGGFALTDYNGDPTHLLDRASEICNTVQKHEDAFAESVPAPAEVAIVFSKRSYLADNSLCVRNNKLSVDCLSGYYRMLWENNVPNDIIHEDFISVQQMKQYKLIILPMAFAISESCAEKLKEYMAAGGTVLADPYFGSFNMDLKLARCIPGYGFAEIAGLKEKDIRIREKLVLHDKNGEYKLSGNYFAEEYHHVTGTPLYCYEDGTPAIVSKGYGLGRMIQSGVNLGHCYAPGATVAEDRSAGADTRTADAKRIVIKICDECGVTPNPCTDSAIRGNILFNDTQDDLLFLLNNENRPVDAKFYVGAGYENATVIFGNGSASYDGNSVCFKVSSYETLVLRLKK